MTEKDEALNMAYVKPGYAQSELTGKIIAAAQAVHHNLGPSFEEVIYQGALALELLAQGTDYSREICLSLYGYPISSHPSTFSNHRRAVMR